MPNGTHEWRSVTEGTLSLGGREEHDNKIQLGIVLECLQRLPSERCLTVLQDEVQP
jgi:hypothetical protein